DERYWSPALSEALAMGLTLPLCCAVVYDSHVHGSWGLIRDRTIAKHGRPAPDEQSWIAHYIDERRAWFAGHGNALLHRSVARMDAFRTLVEAGKWHLELPLTFRGMVVDE